MIGETHADAGLGPATSREKARRDRIRDLSAALRWSMIGVSSLERGASMLRQGVRLVVFLEGSRSPEGDLVPFKGGGFEMALRAGVL